MTLTNNIEKNELSQESTVWFQQESGRNHNSGFLQSCLTDWSGHEGSFHSTSKTCGKVFTAWKFIQLYNCNVPLSVYNIILYFKSLHQIIYSFSQLTTTLNHGNSYLHWGLSDTLLFPSFDSCWFTSCYNPLNMDLTQSSAYN